MRIRSLLLAAAVLVGAGTTTLPAAGTSSDDHAATQAALDRSRRTAGTPGAGLTVRDGEQVWSLSSGTGRLGANQPITGGDRVRIASNTKMYVAAVILQLVAEGKVVLDAPVERYLPGVVKSEHYDGRKITVRQLLQHTSGIAEYFTVELTKNPLNHYQTYSDSQHVRTAMGREPTNAPGKKWSYSNTNYVLAGMLIRAVTGRSAADEITRRIIRPLGLGQTYYPKTGDKWLDGRHARGYMGLGLYLDVTGAEPSMISAAGAMISTGTDMTKFLKALAEGRVLKPVQLAQMRRTIPGVSPSYGLGLAIGKVSCGAIIGHNGALDGYNTYAFTVVGGRQMFSSYNAYPGLASVSTDIGKALDSALCG